MDEFFLLSHDQDDLDSTRQVRLDTDQHCYDNLIVDGKTNIHVVTASQTLCQTIASYDQESGIATVKTPWKTQSGKEVLRVPKPLDMYTIQPHAEETDKMDDFLRDHECFFATILCMCAFCKGQCPRRRVYICRCECRGEQEISPMTGITNPVCAVPFLTPETDLFMSADHCLQLDTASITDYDCVPHHDAHEIELV